MPHRQGHPRDPITEFKLTLLHYSVSCHPTLFSSEHNTMQILTSWPCFPWNISSMRIVIYSPESAQCPQYPEKAQTHGNHSTDDLLKKKNE